MIFLDEVPKTCLNEGEACGSDDKSPLGYKPSHWGGPGCCGSGDSPGYTGKVSFKCNYPRLYPLLQSVPYIVYGKEKATACCERPGGTTGGPSTFSKMCPWEYNGGEIIRS